MTQLILLLIGATLGYCSGWLKSYVDERRKRRAVATALLIEQQRVLATIVWLRDRWRGGRAVPPLAPTMHEHFASDVTLFEPTTVAHVLELSGLLSEIRGSIAHVFASTVREERKRHLRELKGLCQMAATAAELERVALIASGASQPRALVPSFDDFEVEVEVDLDDEDDAR